MTATNIEAGAVSTLEWLAAPGRAIVVPVYQRQYRWDIGACEQLLADIRAVADDDARHLHFLGSVLSSLDEGGAELVLIDGQQRLTTLMLLVAALAHATASADPELSAELSRVLLRDDDPSRTRLRPHRAWAEVFDDVVLGRGGAADSRFDDNYAFFRSQVAAGEAPRIWKGLRKLEHVAITLGAGANAQQIFESLNSTGEPLRDHELIHNYVLMGLTHDEQSAIERDFWLPIERDTGESIGAFWRHYLVLRTGREVAVVGGRGVYAAFRDEFPRLTPDALAGLAAEWRAYAAIWADLVGGRRGGAVGAGLARLAALGTDGAPIVLAAVHDLDTGRIDAGELGSTLDLVESLLLRRRVVGQPTERLIARLVRARSAGFAAFQRAALRITPSDERVRVALRYGALPHPAAVLARLFQATDAGLVVDRIVPAAPADGWTGNGVRTWGELGEDERTSLRALGPTLGDLVLVEEAIADRTLELSFPDRREAYAASAVAATAALAAVPAWDTAAIAARGERLADAFVEVWRRPAGVAIDDDGLTPVLDAVLRRGWPAGWQREFDYVEYRGEHWEVPDVRALFNRVFKRLWADSRGAVLTHAARRGGPVYPEASWNGAWDALDEGHHLYMGWDSRYMLGAVQGVLAEAGLAAEVFVRYSHIGLAMR